jgi:small-conductance mechanosensitive channel
MSNEADKAVGSGDQAVGLEQAQDTVSQFGSDLTAWATNDAISLVIALGVVAVGTAVLLGLRAGAARWLRSDNKSKFRVRRSVDRLLARTLTFFIVVVSAMLAVSVVPVPGGVADGIALIFTVVVVVQGAIWLREIALMALERQAARRPADESGLASAMSVLQWLINLVVWSVALLLILSNLGVDITALIAGLGIGGIAVGLAAQGIVADLFSALSILFDRPFVRGDFILFGDTLGEVERIGLKTTRIRALSGEQIVISNKNLLDNIIHNFRRMAERRVPFKLGIVYETEVNLVARVPGLLKEAVTSVETVRFDRAHLVSFADSWLEFEVVYYVLDRDYNVFADTHQAVLLGILRLFAANGVNIAYPTRRTIQSAANDQGLARASARIAAS